MNINSNLTLADFQQAAEAHPEASRFVLKKEGGTTSIVPHTGSFFGSLIRWITGKESVKNRAFVEAFKQAWKQEEGAPINWSSHSSTPNEQTLVKKGMGAHHIRMMPHIIAVPITSEPVNAVPLTRDEEDAQTILLAQNTYTRANPIFNAISPLFTRDYLREIQSTLNSKTPLKEVTAETNAPLPLMAEKVTLNQKLISQKNIPIVEGQPLIDQRSLESSREVRSDIARPLTDLESAHEQTTLTRQNRANRRKPLPFIIKEPPRGNMPTDSL